MAPYCCGVAGLMGLDRARESSMQPGGGNLTLSRANPTHPPATVPSQLSVGNPRLLLLLFIFSPPFFFRSICPPPYCCTANTNENTNRPWVISLFTVPTVICGHGNGILLHDQGSSDTPLTPLPKINTRQLLVLPLPLPLPTALLGGT